MKCEQPAYRINEAKINRTTVINTCVKSVKTKEAIYHNITLDSTAIHCAKSIALFFYCAYIYMCVCAGVQEFCALSSLRLAYQSKKYIRDRNLTLYILAHPHQRDESTTSGSSKPQQLYTASTQHIYRKLSTLCSN